METAFAPLVGDDPTFMNTPQDIAAAKAAGAPRQQPMNKVIPPELSTMEQRLKAQGSGTSALTTLTAILGAAKGDFRGVVQLEEQKRRTALAKSMVPEITKVNEMVNAGKWEEASDHVNQLANSYGQRADYLVPYFQQMQANIQKKQEGWKNLQFLYNTMKDLPEDNVNYPVAQILKRAVEKRDQPSETTLQGFMTRMAPHIQQFGSTSYGTSPLTMEQQITTAPQRYDDKDFDNVIGLKTATAAGLTPQSMADLFNGRIVKASDKSIIEPNSSQAELIKAHYISQQPVEARLKLMQNLKLESPLIAQLLLQGESTENIALGNFGPGGKAMKTAVEGQEERQTSLAQSIKQMQLDTDPAGLRNAGRVAVHADPSDPKFLSESTELVTVGDVKKSGGKLIAPRAETMDKLVRPAQAAMQSLDRIPDLLEGITAKNMGQRLTSGTAQYLSSKMGFPISANVPPVQHAKTILRTAIELVENTPEQVASISGADRIELRDLKAFTAGTFNTPQEVIRAAQAVKIRLSDIIKRAVAVEMPSTAPAGQSESETLQRKPAVKGRSPASAIAPAIPPTSRASQGKGIDPALEAEIDRAEGIARQSNTGGGGVRVTIPVQGAQQPKGYSEEDEAAKAMARKGQKRMMR